MFSALVSLSAWHRASAFSAILLCGGLICATAWTRFGPDWHYDIPTEIIHPLDKNAYAVMVPMPVWRKIGWGQGAAILRENHAALALPQAPQTDIAKLGLGRYANPRPAEIYFSTSDNTNPQVNGRKYTVQRSPALAPFASGILFVGLIFFATVSVWRFLRKVPETWTKYLPYLTFALIAVVWTGLVLSPAPQIIPTADGGNVAAIIAAETHPARFVADPVFSDPHNFQFYKTAMLPAVKFLYLFAGDIGRAYMLMSAPLIFLQLAGFYCLGRELFRDRFWPSILALASIPPVYVFSGELWGMLPSPLTRSAFAAVFPFLLLAGFKASRSWHAFPIMALCGASVYVHSVSAPSVAFGLLVLLFTCKPQDTSWVKHGFISIAAGFLFLIIAAPFALSFFASFPSATSGNTSLSTTLSETLRHNVGAQYYDAMYALKQFAGTLSEGGRLWISLVWCTAFVAPAVLLLHFKVQNSAKLIAFALGLGMASFGIALGDQVFARIRHAEPYQIDLIRNIRFFVPVLLIALTWLASEMTARAQLRRVEIISACGVALLAAWWLHFPTPIGQALAQVYEQHNDDSARIESQHDRDLLRYISKLPVDTRILPLPHRSNTEDVTNVAMAVRYAAFQPLAYLFKDMNFLSYSGSSDIERWYKTTTSLDLAMQNRDREVAILRNVIQTTHAQYFLVHVSTPTSLKRSAESLGGPVLTFGSWNLIAIRREAH